MTPFEIVAGPLELWLAPVGTAFPNVSVAPAVAWVRIGTNGNANQDDDGVTITHTTKQEVARPAGSLAPVKAWNVEEDLMISMKLWDITAEQYATAINKATVTTTAAATGLGGFKRIGLSQGYDPAVYALLVRGMNMSPYGDTFNVQYEVPRCFQSANAKPVFKKGKPAALELEFTALADLTAASALERFGRLVAQHQAAI
jgi:hypothetical protein